MKNSSYKSKNSFSYPRLTSLFDTKEGITRSSHYIKCKKCGILIAPYKYAFQTHNKACGKKKVKKHDMLCKKVYIHNAKYIIFYDKGRLHRFSFKQLSKYIGINPTTLKARMEKNTWNIEQILGKEPPPIRKKRGPRKNQESAKIRPMLKPKELKTQNLLMTLGIKDG